MQPFDLWDQVAITEVTRRAVDRVLGDAERVANQFAPVTPTRLEKIGRARVKLRALGKARGAIADDAIPPIYRPEMRFVEEGYSLFRLGEMTPVEESLKRALENNGTDADSQGRRDRAGVDIITRARALQIRQENLSDYYVMRAIQDGSIVVKLANPPEGDTMTEFAIDYEYPTGNMVTTATSFVDLVNGKPITQMRAWQTQLRRASGQWGVDFTMGSEVWQLILNSQEVRDAFTWNAPASTTRIPTENMIKQLLFEPDKVTINITDAGWYDEAAGYNVENDLDKSRWIDKERIIVKTTSGNDYRGEPIAEMFDGMVPVQTSWNGYEYRGPGAQSYVQLIQANLTLMWRQECRRLPMIHHPECILTAQVATPGTI